MLGVISKLFGGSKSEKDVKKILPVVDEINRHFASYQSLSHDELRENQRIQATHCGPSCRYQQTDFRQAAGGRSPSFAEINQRM